MLESASYLGLRLLCTYGTPIAKMLEHSPPLPIIIDYIDDCRDIAAEEKVIVLALRRHDRVRHIRLRTSALNMIKLLVTVDQEFPILEYLYIEPLTYDDVGLTLPESFKAPSLRHLVLVNIAIRLGSPLLTTAVGLVTLSLQYIPPSISCRPDELLQRLSFLPQLETLGITFYSPVFNRGVEWQLSHAPFTTHVTLPNVRWFGFEGDSAYWEALLPRMTTPLLEKFQIRFSTELTLALPNLAQFMSATHKLRFGSAKLGFYIKGAILWVYPPESAKTYALSVAIRCGHLDLQVSSAVQIFNALRPVLSAIVGLTLEYGRDTVSPDWHNEADRRQWRELLGSFGNMRALHVPNSLIEQLSASLQTDDEESPTDLFPELEELSYSGDLSAGDALMPFITARRDAGRPVTLARRDVPLSWYWS